MDYISNYVLIPYSFFGDNGAPTPNFVVVGLPEPTTLKLTGLVIIPTLFIACRCRNKLGKSEKLLA